MGVENYIIDTSAWIEFFRGSEEGELVRDFMIEVQNKPITCYTPTIVIAELKKKYVDFGYSSEQFVDALDKIKYLSSINNISEEVAIEGGKLRGESEESGISLIDCILLAMARVNSNCKVLSKDTHIKDKDEGIYIYKGDLE